MYRWDTSPYHLSYYSTYATVVSMRVWVHGATVYGVLSPNTMYRSILTTIYYIVLSITRHITIVLEYKYPVKKRDAFEVGTSSIPLLSRSTPV